MAEHPPGAPVAFIPLCGEPHRQRDLAGVFRFLCRASRSLAFCLLLFLAPPLLLLPPHFLSKNGVVDLPLCRVGQNGVSISNVEECGSRGMLLTDIAVRMPTHDRFPVSPFYLFGRRIFRDGQSVI